MKQSSIQFSKFSGLDFRTTAQDVSFSWKSNVLWFQELYGIVKTGVIHPLPDVSMNIHSGDGRLFNVNNKLYMLKTDWLYVINGSKTGFTQILSQTLQNKKDFWNLFQFYEKSATTSVTWSCQTGSDENFFKVWATLDINAHVNSYVDILEWGTVYKGTYYINANDENTIYIDGIIDYKPTASDTFNIYTPRQCLYVYDGDKLYSIDQTTNTIIDDTTIWECLLDVFNNRIWRTDGNNKLLYSTFNYWHYFQNLNYIPTETTIVDIFVMQNNLYVWTQSGTFAASGTGYTTIQLDRVSQFSHNKRLYPVTNKYNDMFITQDGNLYQFAWWVVQYNYNLIPDTEGKLFSTDLWIIFKLWHGTTQWGILNIEEVKNQKVRTITNFFDGNLQDAIDYDGEMYIVANNIVYRENGKKNITFKLNTIQFPRKIRIEKLQLSSNGSYPTQVQYKTAWVTHTSLLNTYANERSYTIKKMVFEIQIIMDTTDPLVDFTLYYKV